MSSTPTPFPSPASPAQTGEQLHRWSLTTQVLLGAQGICLLGLALMTLVGTLSPVVLVADLWMLQEALRSLLGGLCLLICAAGVVGWLRWQYLCARLIDGTAAGSDRALRRGPVWHITSWMVPVLCLWWPLQNVADLDHEAWRRAHEPAAARDAARPARLGDRGAAVRLAWWSSWLGAAALSWPVTYASYYSAVLLLVLACGAAAASAYCAILLVRRISDGLIGRREESLSQLVRAWAPRPGTPAPGASGGR